jgi:hypothetical protein
VSALARLNQTTVALAAVFVSLAAVAAGVVQNLHTTDASHRDSVQGLQEQRSQSEIVELRNVLDNGAASLALAEARLKFARKLELTGKPVTNTVTRLNLQYRNITKSAESLNIRLGPSHPAARSYHDASSLIKRLITFYETHDSNGKNRDGMLRDLDAQRTAFVDDANHVARSRL